MEDQRSMRGGHFDVHEDGAHSLMRGQVSAISKTAVLSVAGLVLVVGWLFMSPSHEQYSRPESVAAAPEADGVPDLSNIAASANMEVTTSDIAMIGPAVVGALVSQYETLKDSGNYTPETAAAVAEQLGENTFVPVPHKTYTQKDIHTTNDSSYTSMLNYRKALKDALAPMASLKDFELGLFAKYADTKDPVYLDQLHDVVADYAKSTDAAANLTVPSDASGMHIAVLNAMGQFAGVLQGLADNAGDPITVITLLRTYNEAENNVVTSFNNLAMYFAHHPQS